MLGFECSYRAYDVEPGALRDFMAGVRSDPSWRGLSVTMPHKAAAMEYMDEVTDQASALGVLNTVTVDDLPGGGRRLTGHNTDVAGIVGALTNAGADARSPSVILGGGGTAAAALAGLAALGAERTAVHVRAPQRAAALTGIGERLGVTVELKPLDQAAQAMAGAAVVISTLPAHGGDVVARDLAEGRRPQCGAVLLDVAYDPWPSALATVWQAHGGAVVPGLDMLIYQAVEQVRLFSGRSFTAESGVINVMCDAVGAARR